MVTNTGTNAAIPATTRRAVSVSAPSIVYRTGASATIGTTASPATSGDIMRSTAGTVPATTAATTAPSAPTTSPTRALPPVARSARETVGHIATQLPADLRRARQQERGDAGHHDESLPGHEEDDGGDDRGQDPLQRPAAHRVSTPRTGAGLPACSASRTRRMTSK